MSRAAGLSSEELLALVTDRRWFAAKGREPESARVSGVAHADDVLELVLVEIRFPEGTHETYLLSLRFDREGVHEALEDSACVRRLAALSGLEVPCTAVRPVGVTQSNSSVVLDERHVLKLYRRLEAGPNPELELLRALGAAGFANAPRVVGALEHSDGPIETPLAIVTELVPAAGGGWELALESLRSGDLRWLPSRARHLGEVTGSLHASLAAATDPHLAPEEPSAEAVGLLVATLGSEVEQLAAEVPAVADTALAGRTGELHDLIERLSHVGPPGLVIRVHGDYHLGQVLWLERGDWMVIDFEGEPARPLAERRRRTWALRDVAGMLRSFAYAADGSRLLYGVDLPDDWEWSCRAAFLDGWRETVDPRLLPESEPGFERLLSLFELQKLVYELRYELEYRPDWAPIPVAGLERLLELV